MISVSREIYGFVFSFMMGVMAAVVVHIISVGRLVLSRRPFSLLMCEVIGVAVIGGVIATTFLLGSGGELRAYLFIGLVSGCAFYYITIGGYLEMVVVKGVDRLKFRSQAHKPPQLKGKKQE